MQVKDFPSANVNPWSTTGATGVTGHYTQVIWGNTKKVGCGFITRRDDSKQYPNIQVQYNTHSV